MGKSVLARGILILVPCLFCISAPLNALARTELLSLPQVVEYALQHNADLRSLREEKGIHDANRMRAGLFPNPILELGGTSGALTGSDDNTAFLAVSQEFLSAGKREKRRSVAERELDIYRWQLFDRERLLIAEVQKAYYDAILATKRLELTEQAVSLNRQLLEVTRERLAAGDIPELEMNLVKVELSRSEGAKIAASSSRAQTLARLSTLMGLRSGESAAVSGTFHDLPHPRPLAELKDLAESHRPDLRLLRAEKARGEADIVLAQAEGVPNVTASLAFNRDTTTMEIGPLEGKDTAYTIGLKLSIPLPVFDKNRAGLQEAHARLSSAETRLSATVKIIEREVETAYDSFLNDDQIVSLYNDGIIPQLEENLKLTEEAYRLGEIDILAVIQEHKKFFDVHDAYLAALHDRQTAWVRLESAVASDLRGGIQ